MTGWIRDRLFDAATDWLLSGGWVSVVLAIAAAALIWVAIEKAAEQFMTPLLMTAVLMAFAAVFAAAGERRHAASPPPVVVKRPEMPKIKVPAINLSGVGKALGDFLNSIKPPPGPSAEELAARAAAEQAAREAAELAMSQAAEKAEKEAAAHRKAMEARVCTAAIRARNEMAKAAINSRISYDLWQAQMQEQSRQQELLRQRQAMMMLPPPVLLPARPR